MTIYRIEGNNTGMNYIKELDSKPHACCNLCVASQESVFYELHLKKGEAFHRKLQDETYLIYLQKGELLINYGIGKSARLSPHQLMLLPQKMQAVCTPANDTFAIACLVKGNDLKVCDSYSQGMLEKQIDELHETLSTNRFLCSLSCNEMIIQYFKTLKKAFDQGITCLNFQCIKRQELFLYLHMCFPLEQLYNPQIQISAESGTKRSIFWQKNKTKRSKNRLHTTLIKPEQKVNEDLCSGFVLS